MYFRTCIYVSIWTLLRRRVREQSGSSAAYTFSATSVFVLLYKYLRQHCILLRRGEFANRAKILPAGSPLRQYLCLCTSILALHTPAVWQVREQSGSAVCTQRLLSEQPEGLVSICTFVPVFTSVFVRLYQQSRQTEYQYLRVHVLSAQPEGLRYVNSELRHRFLRQYLYFCTRSTPDQYLYFCTRQACKLLSTCDQLPKNSLLPETP